MPTAAIPAIDHAASMDDLLRVAFDSNPMEYETLDARIAKGIAKLIPSRIQGKIAMPT